MSHLHCECGNALRVGAKLVGKAAACSRCKRVLRFVTATPSPDCTFDARLIVEAGPERRVGEVAFLAGPEPVEVGRLPERHLSLIGEGVSRRHCRVIPEADGWSIEDTGSTQGVFVNGNRVTRCRLSDGDRIRLGAFRFRYRTDTSNQPEPAVLAESAAAAPDPETELYELLLPSEPAAAPPLPPSVSAAEPTPDAVARLLDAPPLPPLAPTGIDCPSCGRQLAQSAKICVNCGIDVQSGRTLITSRGLNENMVHANAEGTLRWVSWLIPFGLYPIASEGYGNAKPYTTWTIFGLTLVASIAFLASAIASGEMIPPGSGFMLWAGDPEAMPDELDEILLAMQMGDVQHQFQPHQLLTHAFLHADLLHLAGNMLFLLVLGSRVNALIGNLWTAAIYPVVALLAALAHMASVAGEPVGPMLGASGAVMGLAGMYLVLFPVHRVYMAIWLRLGLLTGFKLLWKVWAVRGFWVVLFYIAFDVIATLLGAEDGVAHWAHLGGFIAGAAIAFLMLVARLVNARGGDLVSVLFGRHAWALLGKPAERVAVAT